MKLQVAGELIGAPEKYTITLPPRSTINLVQSIITSEIRDPNHEHPNRRVPFLLQHLSNRPSSREDRKQMLSKALAALPWQIQRRRRRKHRRRCISHGGRCRSIIRVVRKRTHWHDIGGDGACHCDRQRRSCSRRVCHGIVGTHVRSEAATIRPVHLYW